MKNGIKYIGNYKENEYDGKGTMYYPDGRIYEGMWKKGKQDGEGTLFNEDGTF